ncbi:MAG: TldD/PmbA family protein [Chloroflexi bacterium]|nr:TldD/PmbA family protein [Chloroflexota bacterium]
MTDRPTLSLDPALIERVLAEALATGGEFADLFAEDRRATTFTMEDDRLDRLQLTQERGVGVRVVANGVTGYAYADGWDEAGLLSAARAARDVAHAPAPSAQVSRLIPVEAGHAPRPARPAEWATIDERAALLERANAAAREAGPEVVQVTVRFADVVQRVLIASSDGTLAEDERRVVQMMTAVTAERNGVRQVGRRARGGQLGLELYDRHAPEILGRETADGAIRMLDAIPAPAGTMPVVISNGWGGVLFHEAVGHGLEADHIERNSSVYAGKLGQRVANPIVTLIDDATIPNHRGSYRVDDEGVAGQRTMCVVDGVLEGYLTDRKHARALGLPTSGNGRRQSFQKLPIPRMTNLIVQPGPSTPEEVLADTPRGLFVVSLGGGQVDTTSGQFVFSVTEGYLIENGRLTVPVRGATLAGDSFSVLARVDAVANDFALDPGLGTCGKQGQHVPVGVGQPTLRVSEMIVGGTAGGGA